ncbi:MAG: 50S ribosomal protein L11 methyltransferase [Desulfobacterales bacterium]|nr:50S ribosomal protein L11 methyltransferase [Desulfobacterales bacterium]
MKWVEVKVIFEPKDNLDLCDLITDSFYEVGVKGVTIIEPETEPIEGWAEDALKGSDFYAVIGYFPDNELLDKRCIQLEEFLLKHNVKVIYSTIDEQDWAESWKEYFFPEKITENIVIKPSWREYKGNKEEIIIEIDPGMAFGTGLHATTSMCIQMIQKYIKKNDTVLDVGTGSGILMIAAIKLGAKKVCGIDIDEVAVEIAKDNLNKNKISDDKFSIFPGNLLQNIKTSFDIIVANILSEVVLVLLDDIKTFLNPGGIFILSGITEVNKNLVIDKINLLNFKLIEVMSKDRWVAIVGGDFAS